MEIYYLIVGIALCGILVSIWNNRQKNKQMQENVDESHPSASASLSDHDESSNQARTRDLFLETLIKLGCQYELADGENRFLLPGRMLFCLCIKLQTLCFALGYVLETSGIARY